MQSFVSRAVILTCVCSIAMINASAQQPRIEVPIVVTDGIVIQTLYFGTLTGAHYCIDPSDSINGHVEFALPMGPEPGVFDARFVWPRSGSGTSCFDQGGWYDYRPYIGPMQADTFRIKTMMGAGSGMLLSWPAGLSSYFTQLRLRYFDADLGQNINVNMLTTTSVDVTGAGDPATINIIAGESPMSAEENEASPAEFGLAQNYPNPFNPSTSVQFSIANRQSTILKVYDLLGREVATLVDGVIEPGEHAVEWNAENMSSGVYIYRLTSPKATLAKRMLLVK